MSLIVITGLAAEARIAIAHGGAILVGAGRSDRLAVDLDAAIARGARRLLSFGVAGALAPRLQPGDLVVAHGVRDGHRRLVCDPSWRVAMSQRIQSSSPRARPHRGALSHSKNKPDRASPPGLFRFSRSEGWVGFAEAAPHSLSPDIVGVDAPVAHAAAKAGLFATTRAAAVDMESLIVARAARRHGLPFAILRVIADPAHRGLPSAALAAMRADGEVDVGAVLGDLIFKPHQFSALARLALDSRRAFAALARVRALLGADFASPLVGER